MKKFPFYHQLDIMDCGATCLKMIASFYKKHYSLDELREKTYLNKQGSSLLSLSDAAEKIGFRSTAVATDFETLLQDVHLPCIAHWQNRHFVVIYRVTSKHVCVADPAVGKLRYKKEEFISGWFGEDNAVDTGVLLILEPTPKFYEDKVTESPKTEGWGLILPFLRPYKRYIYQLLLSVIAVSLIQLIIPFIAQSLVDTGIRDNNLHFVYIILIAQLVLFVSQAVAEVIRSYLLLYIGNRVSISFLSSFFQKLMLLPHPFFEQKNLGDLFQRISDNERVENFLTSQTLSVLFSVLNLLIFSLILAYYSLLIVGVFCLGVSLYLIWIKLLSHRRILLEHKRFKASSDHQSQVNDLLYGMSEIRLNGSQKRRRWRWESVRIIQHRIDTNTLTVDLIQSRGGAFIHELKNIGVTFLAAYLVIQGEMTLGMLVAVQYILGQLNAPLLSLIGFVQSAQEARLSLSRLSEVNNRPIEDNGQNHQTDKLKAADIKIENLSFYYEGPHSPAILNDINAEIPYGKVTAIVGASGSGKTTLLKLLLKFYEPSSGKIHLGDHSLQQYSSSDWLSQCGVVMQDGYIFDDTILANITESDSVSPLDKSRLLHAICIAHLEKFIASLHKGLHTPIGQNGVGISGGQRQRILIARAVYKNPDYLFFDEATSALDAESESYIVNNFENFFQDRTVIIVAHRLSTVRHADQILVMDNGELMESGSHKELTELRGKYYSLVKNQLELGT